MAVRRFRSFGQLQPQLTSVLCDREPAQPHVFSARAEQISYRDEDELVEVLAKHHVAIGVSVPEVVPDGTGNLAKYWSEWQDLNLDPLVPNEALDHRTRYGNSADAPYSSRKAAGTANPAGGLCRVRPGFLPRGVPVGWRRANR